jgi:hypothetical protein
MLFHLKSFKLVLQYSKIQKKEWMWDPHLHAYGVKLHIGQLKMDGHVRRVLWWHHPNHISFVWVWDFLKRALSTCHPRGWKLISSFPRSWDISGWLLRFPPNAPLLSARATTSSFGLFSLQWLEGTSGFSHL